MAIKITVSLSRGKCMFASTYRVAQLNWYQLTFLPVTFERPDVIRLFLLSCSTVYSHTLRSITV